MSWCQIVLTWKPHTNNYQQKNILNEWKSVQLFKLKSSDITKNIIQYFISSKTQFSKKRGQTNHGESPVL